MLLRAYLQTHHGLARRQIIHLIDEGQIFLNDKKVEDYKTELKPQDLLTIPSLKLDEKVNLKQVSAFSEVLLFNKPPGYTCSKSDPHNRTFYELLPKEFQKQYYYIGRLDKESRGLMLLTTNPELVHQLEHPSKEIPKTYLVKLNRPFDWKQKATILKGIHEWGEFLRTIKIEKSDSWMIEITLNEGKKRHIRRIFKALGYSVLDLQRISIGNYQLWNLQEGKWLPVD